MIILISKLPDTIGRTAHGWHLAEALPANSATFYGLPESESRPLIIFDKLNDNKIEVLTCSIKSCCTGIYV